MGESSEQKLHPGEVLKGSRGLGCWGQVSPVTSRMTWARSTSRSKVISMGHMRRISLQEWCSGS